MAKSTLIELGPDDPIFKEGPQVFIPCPRPLPLPPDLPADGCPACRGQGLLLGVLGRFQNYRCRDCGWTWLRPISGDD